MSFSSSTLALESSLFINDFFLTTLFVFWIIVFLALAASAATNSGVEVVEVEAPTSGQKLSKTKLERKEKDEVAILVGSRKNSVTKAVR